MVRARILVAAGLVFVCCGAQARTRNGADPYGGHVPYLDVKTSCSDAQKFSSDSADKSKDKAFKGCMQDEMNAKTELAKRWTSFKPKDRQNCVEQARAPSPSYVEVLTCLEMDSGVMTNGSAGQNPPPIGGPVAPGLASPAPVPLANPSFPTPRT